MTNQEKQEINQEIDNIIENIVNEFFPPIPKIDLDESRRLDTIRESIENQHLG